MKHQKNPELSISVGLEAGYQFHVPVHSTDTIPVTVAEGVQEHVLIPELVDIVQVVGGPGVSGSAVRYPDMGVREHYYSTAIPQEGAVYLDGKQIEVGVNRDAIIHEIGFDQLAEIPFGIFSALNSDIRILQPSSFGAVTYLAGKMYSRKEHVDIDGIVLRSPYFMTADEGLHQISDPEAVKSSGVRLKMLSELLPQSALTSRRAFMESLAEQYYTAKERGDEHAMAQIALGLVGHQLKVGEATYPDNLSAKAQKLLVNQDWMYTTKSPDKVLSIIKSLTGADAYLGAELLFQFERQNTTVLGEYDSTLDIMNEERDQIREAIGSTALGRVIILSGMNDKLTPTHLGARVFQDAIGSDLVEVRTVSDAGHPGYDKNMRRALRATMKEVLDKIMKQKGSA